MLGSQRGRATGGSKPEPKICHKDPNQIKSPRALGRKPRRKPVQQGPPVPQSELPSFQGILCRNSEHERGSNDLKDHIVTLLRMISAGDCGASL